MNLCNDRHDEICYEGRYCPACELLKIIEGLEDDIRKKDDIIDDLEKQI